MIVGLEGLMVAFRTAANTGRTADNTESLRNTSRKSLAGSWVLVNVRSFSRRRQMNLGRVKFWLIE
ncbi:hypothetical protein [Nostoc sp. FACHB-190]|uniref:hypothetical protein n=1 Tax=Nostoc sp. FACHB-190 TaxID=2692838 RepID=UPI00168297B8|nr:hypothetical protein [Nostoc sp. FACHB-190]MBD2303168.1 hypothetical protein [Nostoc sp. FACHB-190]